DCSAHEGHDRSLRHDNLYVERQQFVHEFWHAITDIGRPTWFDDDGSTLDVVQLPQSLSNGIKELRSLGRADCDPPDPRHPCRLLRAYGKRIYRCRTAEQRDELAPLHVGPPLPESVYQMLSVPQGLRRVLGAGLHCSESGWQTAGALPRGLMSESGHKRKGLQRAYSVRITSKSGHR